MKPTRRALPILAAALLAAACGPGSRASEADPGVPEPGTDGWPRAVALPDGTTLVVPARPVRILPCNASAVDFLVELVEPGRVAALPRTVRRFASLGDAPAGWDELPIIDDLETETVIARDPDLVIAHAWQDASAVEVLRRAGIPVLRLPETHAWEDVHEVVRVLARALDAEPAARALLAACDERAAALARDDSRAGLAAMTYSNFGTGGWTAGTNTTFDALIGLAGLENAAARAGVVGHARVEIEELLRIDPDFLIVTEPEGDEEDDPTLGMLRSEPGLRDLAAVRAGRIALLPARLALADSHRIVDAAEALAAEVDRLRGAAGETADPGGSPAPRGGR